MNLETLITEFEAIVNRHATETEISTIKWVMAKCQTPLL